MQIRDRYVETFKEIQDRYGEEESDHLIGPDDSLQKVIGYTKEYIVGGSRPHYRYDYYRDSLDWALTNLGFDAENRVVCLDQGCGPGLFSWVVQDYLLSRHVRYVSDVDCIGYDHAESMIRLATLFQKHLPIRFNLKGYWEIDKLRTKLRSKDFSHSAVIVTLGHVLIQAKDDPNSMRDFARIIRNLFPSSSCIVVAVDAHSGNKRQIFREACESFWNLLEKTGVRVEARKISEERSSMYARLAMRT